VGRSVVVGGCVMVGLGVVGYGYNWVWIIVGIDGLGMNVCLNMWLLWVRDLV
jgi:hypothetical protein